MSINNSIASLVGDIDFNPDELRKKYDAERDKRLRPDGNEQYIKMSGEYAEYAKDPYTDEAGLVRDPVNDYVETVVIGGGFAGLIAAAHLKKAGLDDIRIIEKGGDFGGTWYWNRYPGAMCDVESYCYLPLLEELDYIPKHRYSYAPEILDHSKAIARAFDFYDKALLGTCVTGLVWDEAASQWNVTTDRGDTIRARYVVMGNGPLNIPKLPGIPGITSFKGKTFHTSRWDYDYTGGDNSGGLTRLGDKRVGIIGTGATAIQAVPHLGEWAEKLYVFQRTPSSIDVRNNASTDPDWVRTLKPGWQEERMANFTLLVSGGTAETDLVGDGWTEIFRSLTSYAGSEAAKKLGRPLTRAELEELNVLADYRKMNALRDRIDSIVKDRGTADVLKPWYRLLCKRPGFHDEYLDTFNRPGVTLVDASDGGIEKVVENGVIVGGTFYELDCLIFATGFETGTTVTRRSGYDVIGRHGAKLSEAWKDGPKTLHGLYSRDFPNCFFIGFNQSPVTVNIPHAYTEQARHLAYVLSKVRDAGKTIVDISQHAQDAYCEEALRLSKRGEKFYAECTPGYYNGEGKKGVTYLSGAHGATAPDFFQSLKDWRDRGDLDGLVLS